MKTSTDMFSRDKGVFVAPAPEESALAAALYRLMTGARLCCSLVKTDSRQNHCCKFVQAEVGSTARWVLAGHARSPPSLGVRRIPWESLRSRLPATWPAGH